MGLEIKESDWKLFRRLRKVALERFCERVLSEVRLAAADTGEGYHQRYLKVFDLLRDRDKTMGSSFDDLRRSNALMQLANIKQEGLLSAEELAQFSTETRQALDDIEYLRRA